MLYLSLFSNEKKKWNGTLIKLILGTLVGNSRLFLYDNYYIAAFDEQFWLNDLKVITEKLKYELCKKYNNIT